MSAAHTPGPWKTEALPVRGFITIVGPANANGVEESIAVVHGGDANARLIAAAPELLDALKGVVNAAAGTVADMNCALGPVRVAIGNASGSHSVFVSPPQRRLWNIAQVAAFLQDCGAAASIPTIYRKLRAGAFPQPVRFNTRCNRWDAEEVRAWLATAGRAT